MQNLINELQLPRQITPSPAALRAAKALQELHSRAESDLKARLSAEQKLAECFGDIQRLTKELNDAKATIASITAATSSNEPSQST